MTLARFKPFAALLGLIAAGSLALALPTAAQAQDKPKIIRISYSGAGTGGRPITGGTIISTAHQQGVLEKEFAKDGIKIQWTFNPGAGPATNEQLANGLADFAHHGDLPIIIGRSTGLRTKILFSYTRFGSSYITGPIDSQAKSLEDLKGKRLAVFKGTASQLALGRILKKHGLTERDFKTVSMDGDTLRAAIATKDVEAGFIAPFDLAARGVGKLIYETGPDPDLTSQGVFWVSEEFERKYPDIVQRVVTALIKVAAWSSDEKNREAQYKLWANSGTSYYEYQKTFADTPLKWRLSPLLDDYFVDNLKKSIVQAKEFKLIRRDVDLNGWLAPQYLNTALKELKLEGYWPEFNAAGKPKVAQK
ncbi:ABC transporter substrate-binding protein [Herbaspirillum sp. SJZ107]|uniref:ABC transporter substrate-binding protein n=1 Tax=Herbaspirillum sp. SJZ107 TaxID=2572881 RepID=UPI00116B9206|nr:ABC transporter substrate-binding protein [Herbaspirillum sp. SJZ107]TQK11353.1 sulfonate transport system substrate-binding protein [Herbaspirillum sp. SJZ107]